MSHGGPVIENLDGGFALVQWTVNPRQSVLRDGNGEKRIEPKVMEVLVYLAEHAGDVVTRDELLDNVWSGMVVGDEALSRAISLLRTNLEDDPRKPIFIQTVPRRGYRLIATPRPLTAEIAGTSAPPPAEAAAHWWRYAAGAAVMLILALVIWRAMVSTSSDPWREAELLGRPVAVAVLPFSIRGPIPQERAFVAESLADEIIVALSDIEEVRVVARGSSFAAGAAPHDIRAIGEALDVDAVIEGSVLWQGQRARINTHLDSARDGYQIWVQTFDSDLRDVFYVQDAISDAVVAELERSLGRTLTRRGTVGSSHIPDARAYELFLRGRLLWKQRGEAPLRGSIERFREAIAIDPHYARAQLALAQAYLDLPFYSDAPQTEMFARAEQSLAQAQALDPSLEAEVRGIHGFIASRQLRWGEADEDFRYAIERVPEDAELHNRYSQFLSRVGKTRLALEQAKIARALDALSPAINARLAVTYMWADDNDAAGRQWAIGDELGFRGKEDFRTYWRAQVLHMVRQGDAAGAREALAMHQRQAALPVEPVLPLIDAFIDPDLRPQARVAARKAVEAGMVPPVMQWPMWILLDDLDAAFEVFHALEPTPWDLDVEFLFARETARFRADPRFLQHAEHIGLTEYWRKYGPPDVQLTGTASEAAAR